MDEVIPFRNVLKRDPLLHSEVLRSGLKSISVREGIFLPQNSRFVSLIRMTSGDEDFRLNLSSGILQLDKKPAKTL